MEKGKRGSVWLWVLVVVIVVVAGVYFLFFSGGYPSEISGYPLEGDYDENAAEVDTCLDIGSGEEVCVKGVASAVYGDNRERNDVQIFEMTSGAGAHRTYMKSLCSDPLYSCEGNVIVDGKSYSAQKMIYWFYDDGDSYVSIKQWGDSVQGLDSPVVEYFLNKYPPVSV